MDESGDNNLKECPKWWDKYLKECLDSWILMVSLSPIAFLLFMLMALYSLLRFLYKVALLFIIVAINTPFAVMYNLSIIVFKYNFARLWKSNRDWNWSDPRANVGIEVKLFVSDFLKVVAVELLLLLSTGIITYYTAPLKVFYISTVVWVVAIFHQWLNNNCLSKTVLSCLCDGYGLSPMMFLFSFIGFFDIGCHPIAKCSFVAEKAFLFVKDGPNQSSKEDVHNQLSTRVDPVVTGIIASQIDCRRNSNHQTDFMKIGPKASDIEEGHSELNEKNGENGRFDEGLKKRDMEDFDRIPNEEKHCTDKKYNDKPIISTKMGKFQLPPLKQSDKGLDAKVVDRHQFNGAMINPKQFIEFFGWNAFERGLFKLNPRINFISRDGKYILKSLMVLKLHKVNLCEYPVERLELPEDYSKVNELYNFLVALSEAHGFVIDKMRGRHEHSLTLLEIVEGVEENDEYRIVHPKDKVFVVA